MADSLSEALNSTEEVTYTPSERFKFIVDNDLRTISSPTIGQAFGVYHDRNVQVVDWEMPRYYHDVDLAEYTARIHYLANNTGHIYLVTDMSFTDDTITFTWTVDLPAYLENGGTVTFALCMRKVDGGGYVTNEFNTTVYSVSTLKGLQVEIDPGDEPLIRDYLAQIQAMVQHVDQIDQTFDDRVEEAIDDAVEEVNTAASGHISTMQTLADNAAASASNASQSATNAAASAQTAKDEADRAFDTTPEGYEVIAQKNKTEDEIYEGNPIEIETLTERYVKKLAVDISPIQDLHGYDHPWPAGGGKNLFPLTLADLKAINTLGKWSDNVYSYRGVTYTVTFDNGGNIDGIIINGTAEYISYLMLVSNANAILSVGTTYTISGCASGGSSSTYNITIGTTPDTSRLAYDVGGSATFTYTSTYDEITRNAYIAIARGVSISNMTFKPMLEVGTSATAYEPYSNICPISGRTEIDVTRTSHNIWDEEWESGTINATTGAKRGSVERIRSKNYIPVAPNTTYHTQINNYSIPIYACLRYAYDADKNPIGVIGSNYTVEFTTPSNCHYILFSPNAQYGTTYKNDICINISDPAKNGTYEPYQGQSVTVQLGQTVYGGTVDFVTGKCRITKAIVDLGTLRWNRTTSYNNPVFYANLLGKAKNYDTMLNTIYLCVEPVLGAQTFANNSADKTMTHCYDNEQVFVRDDSYSTADSFKTAMSGVMSTYTLATPIELTLTPAQLALLEGYNILTTDGTTMSVTVRKGAYQLLSEAKATEEELTAMIESQKYFYIDSEGYGCIDYDLFNSQ